MEKLFPVNLENSPRIQHCLETSRYVAEYFGNENMMDLIEEDYTAEILCLLGYCQGIVTQFVKLASQTGAHCVSTGDSVAGPDMISPDMYRKLQDGYENNAWCAFLSNYCQWEFGPQFGFLALINILFSPSLFCFQYIRVRCVQVKKNSEIFQESAETQE